jgi:hypothetical protein
MKAMLRQQVFQWAYPMGVYLNLVYHLDPSVSQSDILSHKHFREWIYINF